MNREGITEKVTFELRPKGGKGVTHVDIRNTSEHEVQVP